MIKKLFKWIFREELQGLATEKKKYQEQTKRVDNLLDNLDVSVDVHEYSSSWACISIQGQRSDYIKFIDLGQKDIREIQHFLRQYDRRKVDASPNSSKFFKFT